jgi:Ser/Thr protein kinase RdoA (MazF antagonist)
MKSYAKLTVRGQAHRLRQLALEALGQYDLEIKRIKFLTNHLNGIYRLDTHDGQKYIMRITLPEGGHTLDHITAEMDWLSVLSRETDLSVPRPVPTKSGKLVVTTSAEGVPQPRICAVFTFLPGKLLVEQMTEANLTRLGELMAILHTHAATYFAPHGLKLLHFDQVCPFPDPFILFEDRFSGFISEKRREIFQSAMNWAKGSIDRLMSCGEPMRILHADLHQWNVLVYRDRLSPIDFEDLMLGWPVQDIAISFYYLQDLENYSALKDALQAGYTRHSPWPERVPGEIDSFIAARALDLANFVLNEYNPAWEIDTAEFMERTEKGLIKLMEARRES